MEFTVIDNIAWELFTLSWNTNTMMKNKIFFVHHKKEYPYCEYYNRAEKELRRQKLEKICTRLETR